MPETTRKLAAIMVTDIVGYTGLWEKMNAKPWSSYRSSGTY